MEGKNLFDRVYSCYFQVVRRILEEAKENPISKKRMKELIDTYAYKESSLTILPKLLNGEWKVLSQNEKGDYESLCDRVGKAPLTKLQKSWLKSVLTDKRCHLFLTEEEISLLEESLSDVEPMFQEGDFLYFDRRRGGDDYASLQYQQNFQVILQALTTGHGIFFDYQEGKKEPISYEVAPYQLEYSSKEDRFSLCCLNKKEGEFQENRLFFLQHILTCHLSENLVPENITSLRFCPIQKTDQPVRIEINGERNSLERCMLHFANYEKRTVYDEKRNVWYCEIVYDKLEEQELITDILSFGPVIRVLSPETILNQVREKVKQQHTWFYSALT